MSSRSKAITITRDDVRPSDPMRDRRQQIEERAVYYANGLVELQDAPTPHHLRVGGYPALVEEVCELTDRVAKLEQRLAKLEEAHEPGIVADTSRRDVTAISWKDYV